MKRTLKQLTAFLLALIMTFSLCSGAWAAETDGSAIPPQEGVLLNAAALSGTCGKNAAWNYDSKTRTLTISGTGEMDAGILGRAWLDRTPSEAEKIVVEEGITSICKDAFVMFYDLKSVSLPKSLKTIGEGAFAETTLESITIPAGVTRIGEGAFEFNCLKTIKVAAGNTVFLVKDGVLFNKKMTKLCAFPAHKGVSSYTVPTSVTTIGAGAFSFYATYGEEQERVFLKKITVPATVTAVGKSAFAKDFQQVYFQGELPAFPGRYEGSDDVNDDLYGYLDLAHPLARVTFCHPDTAKWNAFAKRYQAHGHFGTAKTYVPATVIAASPTNSGIKITWTKSVTATGYEIYRKSGSGDWKKLKKVSNTLSFTDPSGSLSNGANYQYKVLACNAEGKKSGDSNTKTVYFLTKPTISTLSAKAGRKLTAKWKRNTKATGYEIQYSYYSDFRSGSVKSVTIGKNGTVSRTETMKYANRKYFLRIRSFKTVSGKKYYSPWSASKSVKTRR